MTVKKTHLLTLRHLKLNNELGKIWTDQNFRPLMMFNVKLHSKALLFGC